MIKYNVLGEMTAYFGLCENRHEYPVTECIYPENVPTFAFGRLELEAKAKLMPLCQQGLKRLVIYTSGCQSALLAVVNVAQQLRISEIIIMHYDGLNNDYQAQHLVTVKDIYF